MPDDVQSRRPELTGAEPTMPAAALVYVQGHAALLDDGGTRRRTERQQLRLLCPVLGA